MRGIVLLSLFAVLVSDASAQRGGGSGRGGIGRGGFQQGQFRGGGFGFNRGPARFPYGFDYGYDGYLYYDAGSPYGYPPQPIIVVQQPPPQPIVVVQQPPPQPPREVHSAIINYPQPAPGGFVPSEGEPQTFGIVLKDGSTRSAIAVVEGTSDGMLHYVDSEERSLRISMDEVDREATRKLNRERKLNLWLPATPQPTAAPTPNR